MNYRAQFAPPPTPPGFHDADFEAYFDGVTTPALVSTIAAGAELRDIPLYLETDADFIARGIRILDTTGVQVQLREPSGKFLSSDLPLLPPLLPHSYQAGGLNLTPAGAFEQPTVPLEPEIACAAGSCFLAYILNPFGAPVTLSMALCIFGVKRYPNCKQGRA